MIFLLAETTSPDAMNLWLDILFKYGFSVAVAIFFMVKVQPAMDRLTRAITITILQLKRGDKELQEMARQLLRETPSSRSNDVQERAMEHDNDRA